MEKTADQKDENRFGDLADVHQILALNCIIEILDYDKFEHFLISKRMDSNGFVLEGFLFLAKTVSRNLLEIVSRSWSLNFPDDITFSRACNRGVPLSKIKNTSLKTILVKNLQKRLRDWWISKDKAEIRLRYKAVCETVVKPLNTILEKNLCLRDEFAKYGTREVMRRLAIHSAWIFLNDVHRGFPHGYFFSLSENNLSKQYLSRVFQGYKLCLAFVWDQLLTADEKRKSRLPSQLIRSKNWRKIDSFFEAIREKIYDPLEKEFALAFYRKYFQVKIPITPKSFGKKLYGKVAEPALSKEEDLQQTLFWYPVQAMKGSYVFNGVPAFMSVLAGTVTLKRMFRNEDKSYVVRFVHPVAEGKNDYSYAVLIEAYGTLSDYSGWLVFFNCCGDYSGFAGSEHTQAEMLIDHYKKGDAIELIEYEVDSKTLLDYLTVFSAELTETYDPFISKIPVDGEVKKHMKILKEISVSSRLRRLDSDLASARGLLLELVCYYHFVSKGYATKWRYRNSSVIGKDEIDVVTRDESGDLLLVSCMGSFDMAKAKKLHKQTKKVATARKVLKSDFGVFKNVHGTIFLLEDADSRVRRSVRGLNVQFYSLQRIFREDTSFSRAHKPQLEALFRTSQDMQRKRRWFAGRFSQVND